MVAYAVGVSSVPSAAPCEERPARRGRTGINWKFESMYGRTAIIAMNLMVIALVAYSLMRSGRL